MPIRWSISTQGAVVAAMAALLFALTGADFALDRLLDSELVGTLEIERERVVRITAVRRAARRSYVEVLERRLQAAVRQTEARELEALSQARERLASSRWASVEPAAAAGLIALALRFEEEAARELAADGRGPPEWLSALLGEVDALSAGLLARDDSGRDPDAEAAFAGRLDSGLLRLERVRLVEQAVLSLALVAAVWLGLRWARRVERLRIEKDSVDRSRADLQRMAGILAHEVNGQLAVLQNALALLGREVPGHDALRFQQESVDHMRTLVSDFRLFGGTEKLVPVDLDAAALVRSAAAALGVAVEVSGPERLALRGDQPALQRALQNLLRNAYEAGTPVRVTVEPAAGGARFVVEDEGPGLTAEAARRAGEPFFTTKQRGTGLGLAIVAEIARRHGGSFALRNRPQGRGAMAVLEIPAAP